MPVTRQTSYLLVDFSCVDAEHPKHSVCMSRQVMEECLCLAVPASEDAAGVTTDQISPKNTIWGGPNILGGCRNPF